MKQYIKKVYIQFFKELREHLFSAAHINQLKITQGITNNPSPPSSVTVDGGLESNNLLGNILGGQNSQAMANFTIFANIQRIMASHGLAATGVNPAPLANPLTSELPSSATVCEVNESEN